ncbi:Uncharacterised protein [Klebsiella pneumoniae]|uniref:hypothetical protein n=1 Tax=Klebsiella pneumoniae TaxID=573 RepID=UPI0010917D98|nr:hypothetical protein [Klebsiella pneumoniae]VGB93298.1 Uncharacterised protein [Klebsiella pneumoniae]
MQKVTLRTEIVGKNSFQPTHSLIKMESFTSITFLRLALGALSAQSKAESPGFAGAFSLLFLHRHFRMEFDLR